MIMFGQKEVGSSDVCFVIAEIGINHNGSMEIAKKLIDMAVIAGCDAVKFQKRTVTVVYSEAELAQPRDVDKGILTSALERGVLPQENEQRLRSEGLSASTNGDLKWALEFTKDEYQEIDTYCREKGILWFASPWDEESVDFLEDFDTPCYKVASASLTDDNLLRHMRDTGKPIILSTGMADMDMIEHAVEVVGTDNLILLHCTSVYPTLKHGEYDKGLSLVNLRGIETLKCAFPDVPIGFSSHDLGIMPCYAAVAMGACVVEKHITLWRGMAGSDQAASIEQDDLNRFVRAVRELPIAMGDGEIVFYEEEKPVAKKLRREWGTWESKL